MRLSSVSDWDYQHRESVFKRDDIFLLVILTDIFISNCNNVKRELWAVLWYSQCTEAKFLTSPEISIMHSNRLDSWCPILYMFWASNLTLFKMKLSWGLEWDYQHRESVFKRDDIFLSVILTDIFIFTCDNVKRELWAVHILNTLRPSF